MPRVRPEELVELQANTDRIRNLCVLAHVDHGKTTLTDSLISSNGIISERLAGKIRYLDGTEEEQLRGITMESSAISLLYRPAPSSPPASSTASCSNSAKKQEEDDKSSQEHKTLGERRGTSEAGGEEDQEGDSQAPYLINLIDSPGHVDFSSDVSTAVRLCDGAFVVVDALEGVCAQTQTVLRQAYAESVRPCLVLNKMDRLIVELQLQPEEAYRHIRQIIEQVNAVMSSIIATESVHYQGAGHDETEDNRSAESAQESTGKKGEKNGREGGKVEKGERGGSQSSALDALSSHLDSEEQTFFFSPEKGNVCFCSAVDGWAFALGYFAGLLAPRLEIPPGKLRQCLWGEYYYNRKTKKVMQITKSTRSGVPMFAEFVLKPVWALYSSLYMQPDEEKTKQLLRSLRLLKHVPSRVLQQTDRRASLITVFRIWLPLSSALLRMAVRVLPSPKEAQRTRVKKLWPRQFHQIWDSASGDSAQGSTSKKTGCLTQAICDAVARCDTSPTAPTVVYVSKMISVEKTLLSDLPFLENDQLAPSGDHGEPPNGGSERAQEGKGNNECFVGFARVFSGVIRPDKPIFVLSPKYTPEVTSMAIEAVSGTVTSAEKRETKSLEGSKGTHPPAEAFDSDFFSAGRWNSLGDVPSPVRDALRRKAHCHLIAPKGLAEGTSLLSSSGRSSTIPYSPTPLALYLFMGRELHALTEVRAGNIVGILGLGDLVLKTATLSSSLLCPSLSPLPFRAHPIVRVAVEPKNARDMNKLKAGLSLLYKADPTVQVKVQESGELVVIALGELHLERCLKDLRERFAAVPIHVSAPIVPFRETIVEGDVSNAQRSVILKSVMSSRRGGQESCASESVGSLRPDSTGSDFSSRTKVSTVASRNVDGLSPSYRGSSSGANVKGVSKSSERSGRVDEKDARTDADGLIEKVVDAATPNGHCSIYLRALPLPIAVAQLLESHRSTLKAMVEMRRKMQGGNKGPSEASSSGRQDTSTLRESGTGELAEVVGDGGDRSVEGGGIGLQLGRREGDEEGEEEEEGQEGDDMEDDDDDEDGAMATINEFRQAVLAKLVSAGGIWKRVAEEDRVWAFGPRRIGPNLLINLIPKYSARTRILLSDKESTDSDCDLRHLSLQAIESEAVIGSDSEAAVRDRLLDLLENSIVTGFQSGSSSGPLCEEPSWGVAFIVEDVRFSPLLLDTVRKTNTAKIPNDPYGPFTGQVISTVRSGCRQAFLRQPVRMVEAMFKCSLQCEAEQLGNLYGVIAKRRGRVIGEDLVDSSSLFSVSAYVPVVESFGLADELRKKTSGAVSSPQLVFSHWELMDMDPFFQPTTEDEREEHGERIYETNIVRRYIDSIRKRKGLAVEEKIVVHAEKQRTLTRNK